jgi:indole-3-glycerol phosphate synthase
VGTLAVVDLTGTFLGEIVAARRQRSEEARQRVPLKNVQAAAEARAERRDVAAALRGSSLPSTSLGDGERSRTVRVIAEMKRASPSRGLLRQHYRRREIAQSYERAGAAALSVLTEEQFFLGSLDDLAEARAAVGVPVLRKDFILDAYQVYESVTAGADALLLIVAALADEELRSLLSLCGRLQVAALVEVHTHEELERALEAGARIVGVNNRDLKTLEVDLETSFRLRARIPSDCLAVSESGIKTAGDVRSLAEAGYHAILIGERLMTAPDPGKALAELLEGAEAKAVGGR